MRTCCHACFAIQVKQSNASQQRIAAHMPSVRERLGTVSANQVTLVMVTSVNVSKLEYLLLLVYKIAEIFERIFPDWKAIIFYILSE